MNTLAQAHRASTQKSQRRLMFRQQNVIQETEAGKSQALGQPGKDSEVLFPKGKKDEKEEEKEPGLVMHAWNPRTQEAGGRKTRSSRPALAIQTIGCQPELSEALSQKEKKKESNK